MTKMCGLTLRGIHSQVDCVRLQITCTKIVFSNGTWWIDTLDRTKNRFSFFEEFFQLVTCLRDNRTLLLMWWPLNLRITVQVGPLKKIRSFATSTIQKFSLLEVCHQFNNLNQKNPIEIIGTVCRACFEILHSPNCINSNAKYIICREIERERGKECCSKFSPLMWLWMESEILITVIAKY